MISSERDNAYHIMFCLLVWVGLITPTFISYIKTLYLMMNKYCISLVCHSSISLNCHILQTSLYRNAYCTYVHRDIILFTSYFDMSKELIIFIIKHEFVASHFFLVSLMYLSNKKPLCLLKLIFQSNVVAFLASYYRGLW